MADVLVLQHVGPETPGTIGEALTGRGHDLRTVRIHEGEAVPDTLGDAAALVVMGGPMGVYETDEHPHLGDEVRLIEEALRKGRPVLGVCLGSQLLAAALGARVESAEKKEIGWHEVTLTEEASEDPLWSGIDSPFMGFHWHGDVFELPEGAARLAESEMTDTQAFRYGKSNYGILFHMEVTPEIVRGMTQAFAGELAEEGLSGDQIRRQADEHLPGLRAVGRRVFDRWAGLTSEKQPAAQAQP
jgi:GMP synthase (glutamine-hydrolysing)